MISGYDLLFRCMRKYFGFGIASEWPHYAPEYIEKIKSGRAYKEYKKLVLKLLTDLKIKEIGITAGLTQYGHDESISKKIKLLKEAQFQHGYYLLSMYAFTEDFDIEFFPTYQAAKQEMGKNKRTFEDYVYYTTIIKIKED